MHYLKPSEQNRTHRRIQPVKLTLSSKKDRLEISPPLFLSEPTTFWAGTFVSQTDATDILDRRPFEKLKHTLQPISEDGPNLNVCVS